MSRVHVALFTTGYPYVDAPLRALDLSRRHGGGFSRSIGEPFSLRRDQFVRWFLGTDATHALMLEGDVVPPEDALERLLAADAPIASAAYFQWTDGRLCSNVQTADDTAWATTIPAGRRAIRRCLLGCVLVSRDAFEKMGAPWFLSTMAATGFISDDEWFGMAAARAGQTMVCDGSVVCQSYRQGADLLALQSTSGERRIPV